MMESIIKENMIWEKNQDMEFINFMMEKSMKVSGKMVSNMAKVK
jgi:hypothetical protein